MHEEGGIDCTSVGQEAIGRIIRALTRISTLFCKGVYFSSINAYKMNYKRNKG